MNENIEIKPIPTDDEYNEVKKKEFKVNNSEEIKPEPITDFERIKLYEIMSNGNKDKLIALLENSNIDRNIGIEYFKNSRNQENPSI